MKSGNLFEHNNQSIIIFGGSGFIGNHLIREFKKRSINNIVIADIVKPVDKIYDKINYVYCDVRKEIPTDIISNPAFVINLAAIHRTPGHADHEYLDTNISGAKNVVDFCERTGSTTLWFTSSISVYGPSEAPQYETSELKPESAYGHSKLQAEMIHRAWWGKDPQKRKLLIARPGVVFGSGERGNFTRLAKALKRGFFVYPGRKDTIKACGYVEDLISSFFFMDEQPDRYILYNYCYPKPYTIKEICDAFVKVAKLHRPIATIPLSMMVNVSKIFQFLDSMGLKNGIHPARMYKLTRSTHIVPDELIRRRYPYQTDLEEGVRRWMNDEPTGIFV